MHNPNPNANMLPRLLISSVFLQCLPTCIGVVGPAASRNGIVQPAHHCFTVDIALNKLRAVINTSFLDQVVMIGRTY